VANRGNTCGHEVVRDRLEGPYRPAGGVELVSGGHTTRLGCKLQVIRMGSDEVRHVNILTSRWIPSFYMSKNDGQIQNRQLSQLCGLEPRDPISNSSYWDPEYGLLRMRAFCRLVSAQRTMSSQRLDSRRRKGSPTQDVRKHQKTARTLSRSVRRAFTNML
jgi:hypothetical protein